MIAALLRIAKVLAEICLYLLGAAATGFLVWHVAALVALVTIGPASARLPLASQNQMTILLVSLFALLVTVAGAAQLRARRGVIDSIWVLQVGTGLFALAISYRFAAILLLVALVAWRALRAADDRTACCIWGAMLLVCLLPIDISFRTRAAGAGFVTAETCASTRSVAANNANEIVCVNGGTWLYSEPRWVWVW